MSNDEREPPPTPKISMITATGIGGVRVLYILYDDGQVWQMHQGTDGRTAWTQIDLPR